MEMQTPRMGPETHPPTLRLPHPPPTVSVVSRGRFEGRGAYTTLPLAQSPVYRALPALRSTAPRPQRFVMLQEPKTLAHKMTLTFP